METSWPTVEIAQLCTSVEKVDPIRFFSDGEFSYVDISSIDSGTHQIIDAKIYRTKDAPSRARQLIKENDILFSTVRTNLKRIARVGKQLDEQIASTGFVVLRPSREVLPSYLFYYLITAEFTEEISSMQRGASYPAVRPSDVFSRRIPLAPLPDQKRIVAKLDTLFAHLDQLKSRLDKIPVLLKQFRQAVLRQAVTGKLTEEWRARGHAGIEATDELDKLGLRTLQNLSPLPKGWAWVTFGEYVENHDGLRIPVSSKEREIRSGSYPYYGATGIIDNIDGFTHDGDFLLIGEDGANLLSRARPLSFLATGKIWVNNHAHVVRCRGGFINEYLNLYMNYFDLTSLVTGTAQPKLTQAKMNSIPVPVPSPFEQKEIVNRAETLFAFAGRLEASYRSLDEKIARLPWGILSKAFQGQLVNNECKECPSSTDNLYPG